MNILDKLMADGRSFICTEKKLKARYASLWYTFNNLILGHNLEHIGFVAEI